MIDVGQNLEIPDLTFFIRIILLLNLITTKVSVDPKTEWFWTELSLNITLLYGQGPDLYILDYIQIGNLVNISFGL